MSSNNITDCRPAEDEDSVSMLDVLEDEVQLEADANAVLGGSDPAHCTYDKGYVTRQALYSCITCETKDSEPAGICLACSLECHEGHRLYELYTKRYFRCDCGNKKFVDSKCKLVPEKSDVNLENTYSQNFKGLYCTCHRPYPDPEDQVSGLRTSVSVEPCKCVTDYPDPGDWVDDEMIQCTVCEDWYHGRHLGAAVPDEDFDELVCDTCMKTNSILYYYTSLYPKLQGKVQKIISEQTDDAVEVTKETVTIENTEISQDKSEANSSSDTTDKEKTTEMPVENSTVDSETSKQTESETSKQTESETSNQTESETRKQTESEDSDQPSTSAQITSGNNSVTSLVDSVQPSSSSEQINDNSSSSSHINNDKLKSQVNGETLVKDNVSDKIDTSVCEKSEEKTADGQTECKLKQLQGSGDVRRSGSTYWPDGWREKLCMCPQCKKLYGDLGVTFLTKSSDTIKAYETLGNEKAAPMTQYETGMRALQNMNRVQQVEVLTEYNSMKSELTDYLKKFAENKKMVREEDIREFFQDLKARKRPRNEMQHFCK